MYKEFDDIVTKFKEINSKGYIKGINNNLLNSAGLTLEDLLGKKPDSLFFPDYKGLEIKTTQRFSGYPITLFTTSFDGPSIFESNYILNTYGKYDVQYKDKKVLMTSLYFNKKILYNNYYFQLVFDDKNEFIYIKNIWDVIKNQQEYNIFVSIMIYFYMDVLYSKIGKEIKYMYNFTDIVDLVKSKNTLNDIINKIYVLEQAKLEGTNNVNNKLLLDKIIIELGGEKHE